MPTIREITTLRLENTERFRSFEEESTHLSVVVIVKESSCKKRDKMQE